MELSSLVSVHKILSCLIVLLIFPILFSRKGNQSHKALGLAYVSLTVLVVFTGVFTIILKRESFGNLYYDQILTGVNNLLCMIFGLFEVWGRPKNKTALLGVFLLFILALLLAYLSMRFDLMPGTSKLMLLLIVLPQFNSKKCFLTVQKHVFYFLTSFELSVIPVFFGGGNKFLSKPMGGYIIAHPLAAFLMIMMVYLGLLLCFRDRTGKNLVS